MTEQQQIDETIQRVAAAAIAYYPDVAVDEADFSLEEEAAWCIEPLGELSGAKRSIVVEVIERTIVDPTSTRQELFGVLIELSAS
jgi:hypothetical protein